MRPHQQDRQAGTLVPSHGGADLCQRLPRHHVPRRTLQQETRRRNHSRPALEQGIRHEKRATPARHRAHPLRRTEQQSLLQRGTMVQTAASAQLRDGPPARRNVPKPRQSLRRSHR